MSELAKLPAFQNIKTRRTHASFTDQPVPHELVVHLLTAARWAPSASNRRIQRFVVIESKETIDRLRYVAPGMRGRPPVLILICNDSQQAQVLGVKLQTGSGMDIDTTNWIDVGAAAQNIMLAAHELGLATCPATSFSRSGVCAVLDLPEHLIPEYMVQVGYPAPQPPRTWPKGTSTRLTVDDLTYWHSKKPV